jgi:hypothetical protein
MSTVAEMEALERDYQKRKAEIRADASLSWEKRELKIRELGLEYDQARRAKPARTRGEGGGC